MYASCKYTSISKRGENILIQYVINSLLDNYSSNPRTNKIGTILRLCIVIAIGLLAAGGGVSSIGTPSAMNTSRTLTLVGYIVFAVVLAVLISMMSYFWRKKHTLLPSSQTVCHYPAVRIIS